MFFNIVSILTLIPVVFYTNTVQTKPIFFWEGKNQIIQVFLLGTAVILFLLGASRYDLAQFLGLDQIRKGPSNQGIADSGTLTTSGVLNLVRHPWYLAALLLIWARPLDLSAILVNIIFSFYLIAGIYLEEKKLVREFGEKYHAYRKRVSMLIPYKWLKSKFMK